MILVCGLRIVIHIAHSRHTQFVDFDAVENATVETVSTWMFDCVSSPRHIIYNSSGERKKKLMQIISMQQRLGPGLSWPEKHVSYRQIF